MQLLELTNWQRGSEYNFYSTLRQHLWILQLISLKDQIEFWGLYEFLLKEFSITYVYFPSFFYYSETLYGNLSVLNLYTYEWMNEWMNEVTQSCPTLWDPMEQPTRLLHPWDFPGQSTGVGCHFLLQGISPTQRLNRGLPHYRQTLYHLSYHGMYIMFIDRRTTKNTPWQR